MLTHFSNYWGWYVCLSPFVIGYLYLATGGKGDDQPNRTGPDISGFP